MKKNNNKGFTLAELLIVVAIIAVLVAIAIPVFTTQLEKSRDAVCMSNIRAAYAEASTTYLTNTGATAAVTEGNVTLTPVSGGGFTAAVANVSLKTQQANKWSGLAAELAFLGHTGQMSVADFEALDTGTTVMGEKTVTFTFDVNGNITTVAIS